MTARLVSVLMCLTLACSSATFNPDPVPTSVPSPSPSPTEATTTSIEVDSPPVGGSAQESGSIETDGEQEGRVADLGAVPPPDWLGTRILDRRPDGFGVVLPTPRELVDRRFVTIDRLPPPLGPTYQSSIDLVPAEVVDRSSWSEECPVTLEELRYVRVSHHGFDGRAHTGEIIVHVDVSTDVVALFERLYDLRFPIEEMRVIAASELDLPPTGDGNVTTSFVCRPAVNTTRWSEHAFGLAIDINPFHNPYIKDDLVLPELASAYVNRDEVRPGMVTGEVVDAFAAIGWAWGGDWNSLKDWMHFSQGGS